MFLWAILGSLHNWHSLPTQSRCRCYERDIDELNTLSVEGSYRECTKALLTATAIAQSMAFRA